MSKNLVIVESPAKAKTINKILGDSYVVKASMGHVRDLPEKEFGIDVEKGFKPRYVTIKGREKVLKELQEEAKTAEKIYLAPDPDREGEAIAWHLLAALSRMRGVPPASYDERLAVPPELTAEVDPSMLAGGRWFPLGLDASGAVIVAASNPADPDVAAGACDPHLLTLQALAHAGPRQQAHRPSHLTLDRHQTPMPPAAIRDG